MSVSGAAASGEGEGGQGEEGGRIDRRNKGNAERERVTRSQVATQLSRLKTHAPPYTLFKRRLFIRSYLASCPLPLSLSLFAIYLSRLFDFLSALRFQSGCPPLPLPPPALLRISNFYLFEVSPAALMACVSRYIISPNYDHYLR